MTGLANLATLVVTQQAATTKVAPGGDTAGNFLVNLLPFLPMVLLFYVMLWRPHQQQEKRRREMISALKKNDRVLTSAGIYGTIVQIDPESEKVVVRVDDDKGLKLTFTRSSIVRRAESDDSGTSTGAAAKS